jgi:hypothetical protein
MNVVLAQPRLSGTKAIPASSSDARPDILGNSAEAEQVIHALQREWMQINHHETEPLRSRLHPDTNNSYLRQPVGSA